MKKLLLFIVPLLSFGQTDSLNILFIGNSYTSSNNLPSLISSIANSMGDYVNFESSLVGGATLQNHTNNTNTISLILDGDWDYVVLQEQSQYPAFPLWQVEQEVFPYANELSQLVNEATDKIIKSDFDNRNYIVSNDKLESFGWKPQYTIEDGIEELSDAYKMIIKYNNRNFTNL